MNELDKKLYELFSDKTLSEGCLIMVTNFYKEGDVGVYQGIHHIISVSDFKSFCDIVDDSGGFYELVDMKVLEYNIIGHEPHLEDVFLLAKENQRHPVHTEIALLNDRLKLYDKWISYNPTLSLMNQSEKTKKAIISLFE